MDRYKVHESAQSKELWENLADYWDERMGEEDNRFHREIVRPATLKLLDPRNGELILDAACGNGNFSRFLAGMGVSVVAFDYSEKMIAHARSRCETLLSHISLHVADATDYDEIMALRRYRPFDKAVSNMAVMDITDVRPLLCAVYDLLAPGGIFVFSGVHPCFQTPNMRKFVEVNDYTGESGVRMGIQTYEYIQPKTHMVSAFAANKNQVLHYHRPLSELLGLCFEAGFALDGMEEPIFARREESTRFDWYDIPPALIVRLRKSGKGRGV